MTIHVPVVKDEDSENPIPTAWRETFFEIVEAFKDEDFRLARKIAGVDPISEKDAVRIAGNIENYGAQLISLPGDAWRTSIYRWMRGYWDVLVDLYTEEGASDLVLSARVYEDDHLSYRFEVQSVHVP